MAESPAHNPVIIRATPEFEAFVRQTLDGIRQRNSDQVAAARENAKASGEPVSPLFMTIDEFFEHIHQRAAQMNRMTVRPEDL